MGLIGYARVSTTEDRQVLDRQIGTLNQAGCERIFDDRASGAKAERPGLAACLDHLRKGDVLVVLDLDPLGASRASSSPSSTTSPNARSPSAPSTHRWTRPRLQDAPSSRSRRPSPRWSATSFVSA